MRDLPTSINGYPVMAAARTPSGKGECADQGVVIVLDRETVDSIQRDQFIVWYIASNPAFQNGAWQAMNGDYSLPWSTAVEEFARRMQTNIHLPWSRTLETSQPC